MNLLDIKKRLEFHEGYRAKPYKCTAGFNTIGIGRNLDTNPLTEAESKLIKDKNNITKQEAYFLLENDIMRVIKELDNLLGHQFKKLDDERRYALIDLCFNLGIRKLSQFKKTLEYLRDEEFIKAGDELLNSNYANQVKGRAIRISNLIKTGVWKI